MYEEQRVAGRANESGRYRQPSEHSLSVMVLASNSLQKTRSVLSFTALGRESRNGQPKLLGRIFGLWI